MHHHNLLARERRTWALDQAEVGKLLGLSEDSISNYERGKRVPPLPIALGLELIFDKALAELFPDILHLVANHLVNGAQELSIEIEGLTDKASERKHLLLRGLVERLSHILPGS